MYISDTQECLPRACLTGGDHGEVLLAGLNLQPEPSNPWMRLRVAGGSHHFTATQDAAHALHRPGHSRR